MAPSQRQPPLHMPMPTYLSHRPSNAGSPPPLRSPALAVFALVVAVAFAVHGHIGVVSSPRPAKPPFLRPLFPKVIQILSPFFHSASLPSISDYFREAISRQTETNILDSHSRKRAPTSPFTSSHLSAYQAAALPHHRTFSIHALSGPDSTRVRLRLQKSSLVRLLINDQVHFLQTALPKLAYLSQRALKPETLLHDLPTIAVPSHISTPKHKPHNVYATSEEGNLTGRASHTKFCRLLSERFTPVTQPLPPVTTLIRLPRLPAYAILHTHTVSLSGAAP